ncbi:scaffolding protein [Gordonia phage Strosahl]|uniref:Scaffolding protein n=4 Tax=Soupsvirus TaxID=1982562 RepID=A0A160DGE0_9CAUD|nr:head scaffolding protein [Gordonia phage Rosalind]YP_009269037.1 head scaffolding protein [Gordonia phage KatherineG]YP_009281628.1 head scaffolding protein [Gordonia phage Remus]YP_009596218.1 head scaffolding protein [Gordonia phage Strosahl]YP_009624532.1 head scaffolding protein [Gordonia phage Waits]ASZ73894.1 scaffolding protein [Gordonia phage ShayRa]AXH47815.1 scaffolding protein [Gordonia phage LastResort]QDM56193.1 scaffolding protein [Gordonia phage ReMo]QFP95082.1 scaffolding
MSDTPNAPEGSQTPEVTQQTQEPAPQKTYDQAYVDQLRQEAAGHRVGKKEAVEAAEAKVKAEYEAMLADRDVAYTELQNQLGQAWIELEKVYTSLEAKVPSDKVRQFASILTGEDKDSIAASAQTSFELFGGFDTKSPAFDPTQGTGGRNTLPLNGDPLLNAVKGVLGVK